MNIFSLRIQLLFLVLILNACGGGNNSSNQPRRLSQQGKFIDDYQYQIPVASSDGWQTAHLTDVDIEIEPIDQLLQNILNGAYKAVHGILIIKDDQLVLEEYFDGRQYNEIVTTNFDKETLHNIASITKSYTAIMVGKAIEQGLIASVDDKVIDFFPDYNHLLSQSGKDAITLEDFLTMRAGFNWDESASLEDPNNQLINVWWRSEDWKEALFSIELSDTPGEYWNYNSAVSTALGEIVARVSGQSQDEYMNQHLFIPLGMTDYSLQLLADGGLISLNVRPRDMAKFGQLILNEGMWDGASVINKSWVNTATMEHVDLKRSDGSKYGYQWWSMPFTVGSTTINSYFGRGFGGQFICIFPSLNMVLVLTAGNYEFDSNNVGSLRYMIDQYILPAVLP